MRKAKTVSSFIVARCRNAFQIADSVRFAADCQRQRRFGSNGTPQAAHRQVQALAVYVCVCVYVRSRLIPKRVEIVAPMIHAR